MITDHFESMFSRQVRLASHLVGSFCVYIVHADSIAKDVLQWLKLWGNQFNRQASVCSFVEHLQVLDKLEPALAQFLQTNFSPPLTSSHKNYEREVKAFADRHFPDHFGSYRELSAAQTFRRRMVEIGAWEKFLQWCWEHVDFKKASEVESGTIFKALGAITRKFLTSTSSCEFKIGNKSSDGFFTWADLVTCLQAPNSWKKKRIDR